ncbi:MAG TPA: enoyl-CoA hydratase-related protein [Bacteroidia bacterium]|nr:enoyl-CoA hydratase-related protein [Bacteroidia bacterium]
MKTFENLKYEVAEGICTITVNRPDKLNALNRQTMLELSEAHHQALEDSDVYGIILTGSGTKAFVAGADISEFIGLDVEQGMAMAQAGQDIFKNLEQSSKPVIAAINGFALGGGCELAMACQLRIASDNARFGQPEVNLGLIPGYGGTQRLTRFIGRGKALELLMTAELIGAAEALQLGLVNYVTPPEMLIGKCIEILTKMKSKPPLALAGIIRTVNACYAKDQDGFLKEVEEFGKCFATDDFREGTSAFLEKRKAAFKGK